MPQPYFNPWKDSVLILQEAGWAPGPVWTGEKSRPHQDSNPHHPAHSQSLYRLSYPAHFDSELVQDKTFLCDIKYTMHSNLDIIQKVLEDTVKEMGYEGNDYLMM